MNIYHNTTLAASAVFALWPRVGKKKHTGDRRLAKMQCNADTKTAEIDSSNTGI